ncbi:hypothetical protein BA895_09075 [Humibacillus sp. DSM 29435]|uniref:D-alanyl-D-alanine carboxypeptidase family protein n=1 Tax=Humibacillus sp. DSM 29435 TaxID=1869167 RepID=UPI000872C7B2|nr:serine hydrolase [Humibacillus sp. DSM 29435]OFE14814.1 hypothetical protein BA895_09075 [Humibacillus sp. DSM 29435]
MVDRPTHRPPLTGIVTGLVGAALAFTLSLALLVPVADAATTPVPTPLPTPSCQPWQRPTTVPAGVTLTPRVFPPGPTTGVLATGNARVGATARPRSTTPPRRIVCRTVPPTPFIAPPVDTATVVGGPALAASGVIVDLGRGATPPPEVYDVSYVIADLDSGEILAAKSPHAWLRPASTLKTLTALTLLPRLDPRRKVTATADAQAAAGTRVGIIAGNPYPVGDLVDAMLMFSANDAVYALADAAGGYDRTVALMNAKAKAIGAFDTVTVDPSGLDEGNQRSSAYDLALIGRAAMKLPTFRQTVVKRTAMFPGGTDPAHKVWPAFQIYNINPLLTHYPGAIGVKPGRTDRAQHTFIGAATRGGRRLIVTQMGSVTGAWQPTAALLDWGFAHVGTVRPVGRLVKPGTAVPPSPATSPSPVPAPLTSTPPVVPSSGTSEPAPLAVAVDAAKPPGETASVGASGTVVAIVMGTAWLGVLVGLVLLARRLTSRRGRRRQTSAGF